MKKTKNKKKRMAILLFLTVIITSITMIRWPQANQMEVSICSPEYGTIMETVPASGKIHPAVEVHISPDVSGEIMNIYHKEGDEVQKGELLMKIKQDVYLSLKDQAEASLNALKAQYFQQEAQFWQNEAAYQRDSLLFSEGVISASEFEKTVSIYKVSRAQLKAAAFNIKSGSASLQEAEDNLAKTFIYSPMDGIISRLYVEKGERVVGTSQMAGTELLCIADFTQMEVCVEVNERDILRLDVGDSARIHIEAYPNQMFRGVVTHISTSSSSINTGIEQISDYGVKLNILDLPKGKYGERNPKFFKPGMSATVYIDTEVKNNVITLPIECVTTRKSITFTNSMESQKPEYVFAVEKDTVRMLKVETGIQDFDRIEIKKGIDMSQDWKIVSGPYHLISKELKNGTIINVIHE